MEERTNPAETAEKRQELEELEAERRYKSLVRECLADSYQPARLRRLAREVRRALRVLRRGYAHAVQGGRTAVDEWLGDNYHLLLREGEGTIAGLRHADRQPCEEGEPATYRLFRRLLPEMGLPDRDKLGGLLELADEIRPLTVFELSQLALCLKAALLTLAADACGAEPDDGEKLIALAVGGLRQMAEVDFVALMEEHSIVERLLAQDPAGVYPAMDEDTRADYRRAVAMKAARLGVSEASVAAEAVEKAGAAVGRERHVGCWLLDEDRPARRARGRTALVCTAVLPILASIALAVWVGSPWAVLLLVLPMWELLRPVIEHIARKGLKPRRLPRMELEGIVPEEGRTAITVSALLPNADSAGKMAAHLARLYNTNGRGAVQVCLLADLKQAKYPSMPQDDADIAAMTREIRRLNRQYPGGFVLAVRPRVYSPTMDAYSGWERKRGAITQLIRFIRGQEGGFRTLEGDLSRLRRTKYILALDSDTDMRLDTLSQLVGTALHPCNRPVLDPITGRVTAGYGVLIPRMGVTLDSASPTGFSRVMGGLGGVTAYDVTVGDLYMDGFEESIFAGKGLIDAEAFALVTEDVFPPEQVLSHDILEGSLLRTGLVSDVEMTDGVPSGMGGWLDRLHRWIRGDWQNITFLWHPGLCFTRLDKWKLLDNLRRSVTPAAILLCLLLSPLFARGGQILALAAILSAVSGQLLAALLSLVHGGWLTLTGRYYSRVLPRAMSALAQAGYTLVMLPATAWVGLSGMGIALWRLKSRKKLLEWVTAAEADSKKGGFLAALRRFWYTLLVAGAALVFGGGLVRLMGLAFLALIPLALWSARPAPPRRPALTEAGRDRVHTYAAAMWRYYEELCTAEEHYLPPDNLQESPVWRVAHRTSPTNIGLYLLCILAARDLGFLDVPGLLERVDRTVATVERLEKWKGNLLNWYDTRTLRPLAPRYVSTVDSGNFACCLVALRQGLLEIGGEEAASLAERVEKLYKSMDLSPMYNKRRALFHIGLDPDTGERSPSYYDLLMSESRMTGYYAIATRQIEKKHWGALGRMLAKSAGYVGPVSWTGTMFEYFMPRLLLPAYEGSMGYEALRFCLHCQKRYPPHGVPWGISESGFYAFDSNLNYQYKAHGVPKLALRRGMFADMVVAPYATFLTLTTDAEGALRNLARLERLGMTGRCGFYEAADFTPGRAAQGGYSIVRSYMAHHVGMSLVACANTLLDDIFVRRFMRDVDMARASELMSEQAPVNGSVYDVVKEPHAPELPGRGAAAAQEIALVNPRAPQVHLLSGSEWMLAVSDSGTGVSVCRGLDMTMHSGDLLRRPQGVFTILDGGEGAFSLTRAPDLTAHENHRVSFGDGYAAFYADKGVLSAGLRVLVHPRLPGEQRQLIVQNRSPEPKEVRVLFYFEPCLARREDSEAHPAFSRLFLSARREESAGAVLVTRRQRGEEPPLCLAAGFLEDVPFEYEASREALLVRPTGVASLLGMADAPLSNRGSGVPDVGIALRAVLSLPPKGKQALTFVLTAAPTEGEAVTRLIEMRREGRLTATNAAKSPFGGVEAQLAAQILPDLFYPPRMSREWAQAARENTRGQAALWPLGISGDYPIVLIEVHNAADACRAEPYMRLHRSLQLGGVATELVILYREGGDYDAPVLEALREAAAAVGCTPMLGARAGIHAVNLLLHGEETAAFLTAVCVHNGARDLQRAGLPPVEYQPFLIQSVEKYENIQKNGFAIPGGTFEKGEFRVEGSPRLPWCHVLANPAFGTLVSDKALGFTWAVNARENKLTPWFNDTASDNRGEMVLLRAGGKIYDAVWGAAPVFGEGFARYEGRAGELKTRVTVTVPAAGLYKKVELTIENDTEEEMDVQAAYYIEPVLGVDRRHARHTVARWEQGALLMRNPFSALHGGVILTALGGADGCDCDRGSFLAGNWGGGTLSPVPDPCGTVIVRRKLPPRRREAITFVLGYAAHQTGAMVWPRLAAEAKPAEIKAPRLTCPDEALSVLCSHWLPRQIVNGRLYARTGFYQCGGAWGFRDQLQDSLAAVWLKPALLLRQIERCAAVQFEEGDVLHWWHRLPGRRLRGVRTRCSDDLVWLPYAMAEYIAFTGDASLLDVSVDFLTGDPLSPEEKERYFEPVPAGRPASLYQHGVRALDRAITHGAHGLPLIGSGDWNDGFNRVGEEGQGESVWLAMFLAITLDRFAPFCRARQDEERAVRYETAAQGYRQAADACFEGDHYLRAFLDSGAPLGKAGAEACAIDSLTQSFAVLCGLPAERTGPALDAALRELEDAEHGLVRLFAPSFEKPDSRVGYTASYPPGVRENGGQYTHAAVWLAIALLEAGRTEDGVRVLRLLNTAAKYADGLGERYKGEPYALAGDVYANPACPGRVGWSLYTGAAGWMYTAVLRHLLGLRPQGESLTLAPRLPRDWPGFTLDITLRDTPLQIEVVRLPLTAGEGEQGLFVDDRPAKAIALDGNKHRAELRLQPLG